MLRGRREARREDRQNLGRGGTADHYQMRQQLLSVADGRVGRVVGDVQPDVPPWNRLGYGNNAVEVAYVDVR